MRSWPESALIVAGAVGLYLAPLQFPVLLRFLGFKTVTAAAFMVGAYYRFSASKYIHCPTHFTLLAGSGEPAIEKLLPAKFNRNSNSNPKEIITLVGRETNEDRVYVYIPEPNMFTYENKKNYCSEPFFQKLSIKDNRDNHFVEVYNKYCLPESREKMETLLLVKRLQIPLDLFSRTTTEEKLILHDKIIKFSEGEKYLYDNEYFRHNRGGDYPHRKTYDTFAEDFTLTTRKVLEKIEISKNREFPKSKWIKTSEKAPKFSKKSSSKNVPLSKRTNNLQNLKGTPISKSTYGPEDQPRPILNPELVKILEAKTEDNINSALFREVVKELLARTN